MTAQEFHGWRTRTEQSAGRWMQDLIAYANRGEYLFFKGGTEQGTFVQVTPDGECQTGTYEGALPCISDALFKPSSSRKYCDQKEALRKLYKAMPELRHARCK